MARKPKFVPPYKYERETRAKYEERTEWLRKLHGLLKPGDTITMVLRHRSSSGMYRAIDFYLLKGVRGLVHRQWLSYWMAHAGIGRWDEKREAVGMSGVGMDMGFAAVYELSRMLYPNGFACIDKPGQPPGRHRCPANDHSNQYSAYAHGACFICGNELPDFEIVEDAKIYRREYKTSSTFTRDNLPVCSAKCVTATRRHNDGGYALRYEWLG
jgi:hypothetical protein